MTNFGIVENTQGTQKIPKYEQYLKNMQGTFENMGGKMTINADGSATVELKGRIATQPESALKAKYEADVKNWKAKGFDF